MYIVFKISRISLKHIKLLSAPLNSLYITYYSVNSLLFEVKGICVYTDEYLFNSIQDTVLSLYRIYHCGD